MSMIRGRRKRRRAGFGFGTQAGPGRRLKRRRRAFIGPRRRLNQRTGGFIGIERKFFDTQVSQDAFSATWDVMEPATTNLTAMIQGDGESERIGRKYIIRSIHIRGFVSFPQAESALNPLDTSLARICLVLDPQTNGAQLTATDVMDGGQTDDINAFRNLQFTGRFKVLKDKLIRMERTGLSQGAANQFAAGIRIFPFKWNVQFTGLPVNTSGTTANIANVTTNSLHIIGVATSTSATLSYQCRVRFTG